MILFAIRHKASELLMPQGRRGKGYSHWNPSSPDHKFEAALSTPRLLPDPLTARRCIAQWAATPNGRRWGRQNAWTGEYEDDIDIKPDGRKAEELEVVKVQIRVEARRQ